MKPAALAYTRREVLLGVAGAALATPETRNKIYNPRLAAHTSIWLMEAELHRQSVPEILEPAFTGTARAGYQRVELAPDFLRPEWRDQVLALLEKQKLEPAIVSMEGPLDEQEAAEASRRQVLETARLLMGRGAEFVNFHPAASPESRPRTTAELDTEAYQLNRMGQELGQNGMKLMLAHGSAEMRDSAREWRYVLAHTEASLVSFCLDVDTISRAALRPETLIDTAGPRLRALHLRNTRKGQNEELLRDGDIHMLAIARLLRQMNYDGFLVVDLAPDKSIARQHSVATALGLSRRYVQDVFGARPGYRPAEMGPHVRKRS